MMSYESWLRKNKVSTIEKLPKYKNTDSFEVDEQELFIEITSESKVTSLVKKKLSQCKDLNKIHISLQQLTEESNPISSFLRAIARKNGQSLTHLRVDESLVSTTEQDREDVISSISSLAKLKCLLLNGYFDASEVLSCIEQKQLEFIELSELNFENAVLGEGGNLMFKLLRMKSLKHIHLHSVKMSSKQSILLLKAVKKKNIRLSNDIQVLDLVKAGAIQGDLSSPDCRLCATRKEDFIAYKRISCSRTDLKIKGSGLDQNIFATFEKLNSSKKHRIEIKCWSYNIIKTRYYQKICGVKIKHKLLKMTRGLF